MRAHWLLLAVALLAGCTADVTAGEVASAAERFVSATPATACGLLAPDTFRRFQRDHGDCVTAISELSLPKAANVLRVEVAGESAQAHLPDQVLFLARFPQGWLVTAAGCSREPGDEPSEPYECEVAP